ncbi:hypothetical protein LTS18_004281 [Coniosporium uncinatum]|uniref:Uncharacterized protein n=1 Tax=Coniosporium uncinatum TaxID=93489 RepID=A0ACC3DZS0_9PEZI|nr:hypothetical protein LTS18_004281 [Coniosporium uncinatum]
METLVRLGSSAQLTPHEALSGVFGSISLAAWIFLLVPQLIENYKQGSAEGISLAFLFVWFIGDITNLAGALWAGLVPTVTALAVYFCIADFVLISQCLYYNYVNARRRRKESAVSAQTESSEEEPLLRRGSRSSDNTGLPGSHRRRSSTARSDGGGTGRTASLPSITEEQPRTREWLKNTISIFFVCAAGAVGWAIAWQSHAWKPAPEEGAGNPEDTQPMAMGAQVLGYISAVCYLGARIPQIIKNQRDRSCEGLSLLFFILSLLGNATYGAGILFHSLERRYFLTNLPWLIGSLGTMAEDAVIFVQFHTFGDQSSAVLDA